MADAKEIICRGAARLGHAKANAQGHTRLGFAPFAQLPRAALWQAQRRHRAGAMGGVGHIQPQRATPLPPGLAGGPNRAGQCFVARPDGLDPFAMQHIQRNAQPIKMMGWRGAAPILIKLLGVGARRPIPVAADTRHGRTHLRGLVAEKHKTQARWHHQPLLAGRHGNIDAPCIHLETVHRHRGHAIGHQQCRVAHTIKRCAHRRHIV